MSTETVNIDKATAFFYEHAGFSYNPATETMEQGKRRTAERLARSELHAKAQGWRYDWQDDWEADHEKEFGYTPTTCKMVALEDEDGAVLASLACIDGATSAYRRVIEAELADEALSVKGTDS